MIVFDSLKCKSPKSWNLASEGRELNIEKYILEKYRIFPGWATAPPSCYIMCLLNIHSNFREKNIHICKTQIYRVFSPGWLSARLQSEQFLQAPPQQSSLAGPLHLQGGLQDAFLGEMDLQGSVDI